MIEEKIKAFVRNVEDYPKPGIVFKDITPILASPPLVREITKVMVEKYRDRKIDAVVGVEARGFIFGSILAYALECPFVPVRKAGRLPFQTRSQEYALEYGTAKMEIHIDAIEAGWNVIIHDDLLATGGTAGAAADLVKSFNGKIAAFSFLINLGFLPGEKKLLQQFGVQSDYLANY
jgi:adenine phosphoribosyltransferase